MKKSSKMRHPSIIETPIPTLEETAKRYGVSLAHARWVASLEGPSRNPRRKSRRSTASKNANNSRVAKRKR